MEILDLIGATPGFIRRPIVIEAVTYAVIGVLVGWVLAVILVLYTTPALVGYFNQINILPRDTLELFTLLGFIFTGELLVALFLSLTGSAIAVSRSRKAK